MQAHHLLLLICKDFSENCVFQCYVCVVPVYLCNLNSTILATKAVRKFQCCNHKQLKKVRCENKLSYKIKIVCITRWSVKDYIQRRVMLGILTGQLVWLSLDCHQKLIEILKTL